MAFSAMAGAFLALAAASLVAFIWLLRRLGSAPRTLPVEPSAEQVEAVRAQGETTPPTPEEE